MSKFSHDFKLTSFGERYREYSDGKTTLRIDFVSKSALRVAAYKNEKEILPTFLVKPEADFTPSGRSRLSTAGFEGFAPEIITENGKEKFILENGIEIDLVLYNFCLNYTKNGKALFWDRKPYAYNFDGEFGNGNFHYISREENEKIYGLGDKTGSINKAGRAFRIEATDCMGFDASETDPMYKHLPFYMCQNSVGSYGVFYDTSDTSYFDFGKEINNYYGPYKYFRTEDNALVYYVFFGTKLEILQQFCGLCGRQAFPPKWSFDYCASTMAYTDRPKSEEHMNEINEKVREYDLNCKGFYLSSGYTSIGPQRYVFNWNYEKFPDPKRFIKNFSDNGIEIIPNIKPAFLCDHPMYAELKQKGLFVKDKNGEPFLTQFWDGLGSYLDFTNKEAFDFWKAQVTQKLLDFGIIATWNDNNEFDIKDNDAVAEGFGNGKVSAARIRNTLTYLMVEASYQAQRAKSPALRPFLSSRGSNMAIRRLAQTWSGDNRTEFSDLRYCNYIGLTMSMSGLEFYGHDLGGFTGNMPSRELLLRWLQLGLFQPRFTIHSWNKDGSATMPWSYPDIMPSVKALFSQRKQLLPYMYNCAYRAVCEDLPINAPLCLYYDDENINDDCDSFMFGRDILVTCVFDEGKNEAEVYLPTGDSWYADGRLYEGGSKVKLNITPYDKMPYAVRAGSIIPTDEGKAGFEGDERLVFTVYPLKEGKFETEFFDDDGVSYSYLENDCVKLAFTVECTGSKVIVSYENKGNKKITPEIRLAEEDSRELVVI